MEIDPALWGFAAGWGVILGIFYFGGLWITLQHIWRTDRPKIWLGVSYLVRLLLTLTGFWLVLQKDLGAFLVAFLAFILIRIILTRALAPSKGKRGKTHAHQP